jgi:hypothetical protein
MAVEAVAQLQQRDSESVRAFFDRCAIAIDKHNYTYTVAQKATAAYQAHFQVQMLTYFGNGLKEVIRSRTMGLPNPPQTAEALKDAALVVETDLAREKERQVQAVQEEDVAALTRQFQGWRGRQSNARGSRARAGRGGSGLTCYRCRGVGHVARRCPSDPSVEERRPGQGQRGRGGWMRGRGGRGAFRGRRAGRQGGGWNRPRYNNQVDEEYEDYGEQEGAYDEVQAIQEN